MNRLTRRAALFGCALTLAIGTATVATSASGASLPGQHPASPDFTSMVALSNCSGAIVRWTTSQPSDTALMLTNGHCTKFFGAKEVIVNEPFVRDVDLLNADGSDKATIQTTTLLYGTMYKTDVSLYALGLTYQQLQDQYNEPAITIGAAKASPKQQPIAVISGYWKLEYDCSLNGFAYRLLENGWTWNNSLRYSDDGCHVIGGTSGSPVLAASRIMIGINNTINEDGERCTLDNPCEKNRKGKITVHLNRGYGQEVWVFYTCLASDRTLDLSMKGCMLPSPS